MTQTDARCKAMSRHRTGACSYARREECLVRLLAAAGRQNPG